MFRYSDEMINFLREVVPGTSFENVTILFNKKFGLEKKLLQIKRVCNIRKIKNNISGKFQKGATPFNKGTKGVAKANKTSFKKGITSAITREIGAERIDSIGYIEVKTSKKEWKKKHKLIWENENGKIPSGHCLIFANKNKNDVHLDNLILVNRAELAIMNKYKMHQTTKSLTKSSHLIAKIKIKVKEIEKNNFRSEK